MAISVGGLRQPLTRRRERGVLSVLLAAHGAPVAAERLLAEVWGDDAPGQTLGSLQVAVSRLRTQLEPERAARKGSRLVSTAAGYSLTADVDDVDTWRFEALAEQALAATDSRSAADGERGGTRALDQHAVRRLRLPHRAGRDQPARGAAAHRRGATGAGADRPGSSRRRPEVAGHAGTPTPLPRAAVVAARARAVPVRPAGRCARHPAPAPGAAGRGARRRPLGGDPAARAGGAAPGPLADRARSGAPRPGPQRPALRAAARRTRTRGHHRPAARARRGGVAAGGVDLDRLDAPPAGGRRARHRQVATRHRPRHACTGSGLPGARRPLPRG